MDAGENQPESLGCAEIPLGRRLGRSSKDGELPPVSGGSRLGRDRHSMAIGKSPRPAPTGRLVARSSHAWPFRSVL